MSEFKPWGMTENSFAMLMHLSQLLNFIVPFGGVILVIVMWATQKEQSSMIDLQGRIILNWIVSSLIYIVACVALSFIGIGILGMVALAIAGLVFLVLGAIKANNGEA